MFDLFFHPVWLRVRLHYKNATAERLDKEKKAIMFGLEKAFNEDPLGQIVVMLDMTSCGLVNLVSWSLVCV